MSRLRGPEIKMPKLRVPQFLADLYYDLYDRHLLPVVGVLLVGIVAIPLLLGGSSGSSRTSQNIESGATASAAASAEPSAMVVAKATPGLRDYKRRLHHLHPKDPFVQQYTESSQKEAGESSSETSGGGSPASVESSSTSTTTPEPTGGSTTTVTTPAKPKLTFFSVAIDVKVTPVSSSGGKSSDAEPSVRKNLAPLTMLPSRETPALTYMGPSRDGKKALMVVSSNVTSLFGDSLCVIGSQSCQLLALEPGLPETVVWGASGRTFEVELLKLHLVTSDHLNRAPLGKPKHGHGKSASPDKG
jgi:hypothetical protein